jgi:hypothetical protein
MGRDCASERGQRLEHDRLRGAPGRSWGLLEERALPTPGEFTERLGVRADDIPCVDPAAVERRRRERRAGLGTGPSSNLRTTQASTMTAARLMV